MLTVNCTEWCGLTEPCFCLTPLLAFMTANWMRRASDNRQNRWGPPRLSWSRSTRTLVERKLEGSRMEVRCNSVRLWHYETVDSPMDYKSNEGTRSTVCNHRTNRPVPGVKLQAQQDHHVNNEPGFYSLENAKRNRLETSCKQYRIGELGY